MHLLVGDPTGNLLSVADEQQADLVGIGKTGYDATGSLLGGTAMKLAHRRRGASSSIPLPQRALPRIPPAWNQRSP
jgi:hypothetical protein